MSNTSVVRYSDSELEEFRQLVLDRHKKAQEELTDLRGQILDISENMEGDFGTDYVDDSSVVNDLEMLNNMAIRKRKYLQDLENALIRIKNKTYGICAITGELIDKKRLVAVPTTTKSVVGKAIESGVQPKPKEEEEEDAEDKTKARAKPTRDQPKKVITRVIRKNPSADAAKVRPILDDDDDDEDIFDDDELFGPTKGPRVEIEDEDISDEDDDFSEESRDDLDDIAAEG